MLDFVSLSLYSITLTISLSLTLFARCFTFPLTPENYINKPKTWISLISIFTYLGYRLAFRKLPNQIGRAPLKHLLMNLNVSTSRSDLDVYVGDSRPRGGDDAVRFWNQYFMIQFSPNNRILSRHNHDILSYIAYNGQAMVRTIVMHETFH